jgi:hypothetical protein
VNDNVPGEHHLLNDPHAAPVVPFAKGQYTPCLLLCPNLVEIGLVNIQWFSHLQFLHCNVAGVVCLAKPDKDFTGATIYLSHSANLMIHFLYHALVDTDRINPKRLIVTPSLLHLA